jgi:hypothetical protein
MKNGQWERNMVFTGKIGSWYHQLNQFPEQLFDANGYVMFETEEAYRTSVDLQIAQEVYVPRGISAISRVK